MPAPDPPTATDMAEQFIHEHGGAIVKAGLKGDLPQDALDAAQDLTGALGDVIGAGKQLENDRAELARRRDLLPVDGYSRLLNEANEEAITKTREAESAANRAYARLETTLEDATLPRFNPAREQLARDEAALALSNGNPESAALQFARHGNDEAVADALALGEDVAALSRRATNPERLMADARKIAVDRAKQGDTVAARALREHCPKLGAAKGSAGSTVRRLNPYRL